jgi:hypothetical protein
LNLKKILLCLIACCSLSLILTYSTTSVVAQGEVQEMSIAALKSDKGRTQINKTISVKGYLVVLPEGQAVLVDDLTITSINTPLAQGRHIILDKKSSSMLSQERHHGSFVTLTGKITLSNAPEDLAMAKDFGEVSLLRLSLAKEPQILRERDAKTEIPRYMLGNPRKNPNATMSCKRYALLFSGGVNTANAHPRYWNDIRYLYDVLRNKYGYSDQDIFVIYKDGISPQAGYTVDYPATPTGWTNAVNDLNTRMSTNGKGQLFFFATNHGGGYYDATKAKTISGSSGIAGGISDTSGDESIAPHGAVDPYMIDETVYHYNSSPIQISDDQLATWINSIQFTNLVAVLEPCFSGGLIWDLRGNNRIIMSAANEFEYSWGSATYDFFSMYFTDALSGSKILGSAPVNADTDGNGEVSMLEAFLYAKSVDTWEYPQYEDDGDGISTGSPSVNLTNPTDGYWGKDVYLGCKFTNKGDVWMRDKWSDNGGEPDPATASQNMWESPYIWVRNAPDGLTNQHMHQNPISSATNHVYVKVHNGAHTATTGTLQIFYANASAGLSWNSTPITSGSVTTYGDWTLMNTLMNVTLPGLSTQVLTTPWTIPSTQAGHYCLMARWSSPGDTPMGETSDINANVRNNNNLVWRNMNIIALSSNQSSQKASFIVKNDDKRFKAINLVIKPSISDREMSFLKFGRVTVELDDIMMEAVKRAGIKGNGFRQEGNRFFITNPEGMFLENIVLDPKVKGTVNLIFESLPNTPVRIFEISAIQQGIGGEKGQKTEVIGGVSYRIHKSTIRE